MGGTSSNQTSGQTQTTTPTPWAPGASAVQGAIGQLGGLANLTPTEQAAFGSLTGPQSGILGGYLPQQQNVAQTLYGGGQNFAPIVNNAYQQYQQQLQPFTDPNNLNPMNTPGLSTSLATTQNDIFNQLASSYAGAGRDPSGSGNFAQTLGRGEMQGLAPILTNQYNQNVQNLMNAGSQLFGAGGTTAGLLSGLQQTQLGNMQAGQGAAQGAQDIANSQAVQQLAAEAQKRGITTNALLAQAGIALPASQAYGTTTTTGTGMQQGQQQLSPVQQFALLSGTAFGNQGGLMGGVGRLAGGIGALFPQG